MGENMFVPRCAVRCRECGETLYDGDMAYLIGGRYYCVSCVDDALVVCCDSKEDYHSDEDNTYDDYEE